MTVYVLPGFSGRFCRVYAQRVFREVHAVGGDQSMPSTGVTQRRDHLCNGMQRVVVTGPAEEGQAASDSDPAVVERRQPNFVAGDLYRTGETAVDIEA